MKFKYFDKAEIFVGLREELTICDTCGVEKFCFDAEGYYGTDELISICPDCLESGQLNSKDTFTCNSDKAELKRQLEILNPNLTSNEIFTLVETKTLELEKRTPQLVTWQDWSWPCSDGDYCKFIGYGSKIFFSELAKNINVEDFFKNSFYDTLLFNDNLWTEAVPEEAIKNYEDSNKFSTLFYVFKSLSSDKIITLWDCD